jgi:hypothetical protein
VDVNQFTTMELFCIDPDGGSGASPPTQTLLGSNDLEIASPPQNGTLGGISDEGKVIYTPNKDFKGTDTFTYTGNDGTSDAPPATVNINVGQDNGTDNKAPSISGIKVSNKRWRRGNKLATFSLAPLGTTISFRLSEAARATLVFERAKPGRKVGRKCVKPAAANRKRKKCTRFVSAGRISHSANAGLNRVRFQGKLTGSRKLAPGRYRVVVRARDAAGNSSKKNGPTFTIVPK